ncbi:serine/threonine-protein kinase [Zavarzinella formosa]|uniref:serine/threonine-protein kinase n=1 Tax=Zavarzinella formosa TaxID=360055 RepID=UPI0003794A82|nr:serine/threonine-protein kinase [Zavarzinella formosa]
MPLFGAIEADNDLVPGQVLGRCVVERRIAAGAFGIVYRATHQSLGIPVAVKVLHPTILSNSPDTREQFREEARLLARINHPNLVRLWDFDDDPARPFLVMEYVDGINLADLVEQRGRLPAGMIVRVTLEIVEALAAAFRLGIIHRDIKPANIILTRHESAKLADLGLAMVVETSRDAHFGRKNMANAAIGTVAYLSPEQAMNSANVDHRADMYSLGATLFHLATGRTPFEARSPMEMILKHYEAPVPAVVDLAPDVPEPVSRFIQRLMAKDGDDRFPNYDQLRDELIDLDLTLGAVPTQQPPRNTADKTVSGAAKTDGDKPASPKKWLSGLFRRPGH